MSDRYKVEDQENWREWIDKIPYLKFAPEWQVKVIPPFAGALTRFLVKSGKAQVSVYLDVNNALGYGAADQYWEVHPYKGDVYRCDMHETEKLLRAIKSSIKQQEQALKKGGEG